jgi:hypothetical protein
VEEAWNHGNVAKLGSTWHLAAIARNSCRLSSSRVANASCHSDHRGVTVDIQAQHRTAA